MTTEHHDDSLTAMQRSALARWADADAPVGLADRVMTAWDAELSAAGGAAARVSIGSSRKATVVAIVSAVLAAAAVLALWVRAHASDPTTSDAAQVADATELRAHARAVLAAHCTPCHDATARDADPKALRVFDLSVDDWWSMPTADALPAMNERMSGREGATDADRARVAAFVDDELRRRAGAG